MSKRQYPHYAGREKYRGKPKLCECCASPATHTVSIQLSCFRGDDENHLVCLAHYLMARFDYNAFCDAGEKRQNHLSETIEAQHEETGRMWSGERRNLPQRYHELPETGEAKHD